MTEKCHPKEAAKKKETKLISKKIGFFQRADKAMENESDNDTDNSQYTCNSHHRPGKKNWGNWRSEEESRLSRLHNW